MLKDTVTNWLLPLLPLLTSMRPLYTQHFSPDAVAETVKVAGVVALLNFTGSQLVLGRAVRSVNGAPELVTITVWGWGSLPPTVKLKLRELVETCRLCAHAITLMASHNAIRNGSRIIRTPNPGE
jgi:hypothetical protein